ncbi:MAG: IF-2-associated domain-containing protein, partial [Actinomycetospora chiangmaiensis]|nr:IF-2-associated domain-containing protein [Actinomycetospora chiangmaiensis]
MSDTNNPGDKTAERGPRKPLSLKRPIEQGVVRQSFSHGRTKQVMVETVKRRVGTAPAAAPARDAAPASRPAANTRPAAGAPANPAQRPPQRPAAGGMVLRTLSDQESAAR